MLKGGNVENVETVSFVDSARQRLQTLLHEMPVVRSLPHRFCSMMFEKNDRPFGRSFFMLQ